MVTLPKGFVATRFHGYFWNIIEKQLYSIKQTGVLRPLKHLNPNYWNNFKGGYGVSVNGRRRYLRDEYLGKLVLEDSEIPIKKEKKYEQQHFDFANDSQGTNIDSRVIR